MSKICSKCKISKSLEYFGSRTGVKDGKYSSCRECERTHKNSKYQSNKEYYRKVHNEWRRNNKDKVKWTFILRQYGLNKEQYYKMSLSQGNSCKICKKFDDLVIDHCHKTNKVRSLLCATCNLVLGQIKDNPDIAKSMAEYLIFYGAQDEKTINNHINTNDSKCK